MPKESFSIDTHEALLTTDPLAQWLSRLDLTENDLNDIELKTLRLLLKLDHPLRSQLRWCAIDNAAEKLLQCFVLPGPNGLTFCPPLVFQGRSILMDDTARLKYVYAITGFIRGAKTFLERGVHGFILFVLCYSFFGNINLNLAALKSLYNSKDEVGIVNLVYLLNHLSSNTLYTILFSPLIWGLVKTFTTSYQMARPSQPYLQTLQKQLRKTTHNFWQDTLFWLSPMYEFSRAFRKTDLLLCWDGRIYLDEWSIGAKELVNGMIQTAKHGQAYTQLEAMHVLKLIAHGISLRELSLLKQAGFSTSQLKKIIQVKTEAFDTLKSLLLVPRTATKLSKAKTLPRYLYAHYLLWELGAYRDIKWWNIPLTAFKIFKLYLLVNFIQTVIKNIEAALECPARPGFQFGQGYASWSALYTASCFELRMNLFRSINPAESVEALLQEIPQYHLVGFTQLNLKDKNLFWNETRAIIDAVMQQGAVLVDLYLGNNNIDSLSSEAFVGLNRLQTLDLSDTRLSTIDPNTFAELSELQTLDLSFSLYCVFTPNAFVGLHRLQALNLSNNNNFPISLTSNSFAGFSRLQTLDLSFIGFSSLAPKIFIELNELQALYLNNNGLISITSSAFVGLSRLQILDLGSNHLSTISTSNNFASLDALQVLDLSFNDLTSLASNVFENLNRLTNLDVSSNALGILPVTLFKNMSHLENLAIGNNPFIPTSLNTSFIALLPQQLVSLSIEGGEYNIYRLADAALFAYLTQLQTLDLSFNQLETIESNVFEGLDRLRSLDLRCNQLSPLAANIFVGLHRLKILDLSSNQLSTFIPNTFAGLSMLQSLDVSNQCEGGLCSFTSPASDIFSGLSELQTLDLSANQLTTIASNIFEGLDGLQSLDLSYNFYLNDTAIPAISNAGFKALQRLQLQYNRITVAGVKLLEKILVCMNISSSSPIAKDGIEYTGPVDIKNNLINASDLNAFLLKTQTLMLKSICENILCQGILNPDQSDSCGAAASSSTLTLSISTIHNTTRLLNNWMVESADVGFQTSNGHHTEYDVNGILLWLIIILLTLSSGICLFKYFFTDDSLKDERVEVEKTEDSIAIDCSHEISSDLPIADTTTKSDGNPCSRLTALFKPARKPFSANDALTQEATAERRVGRMSA